MRIEERRVSYGDGFTGSTGSVNEHETHLWGESDGPLRLMRVATEPDAAPRVVLDGHADDNATWARVSWTGVDAEGRARLYLAAYLEADTFRPAEDPAHFPARPVLTLPRRYQAAYLFGSTSNSAEWVAHALSAGGRSIKVDTVYSYLSRVRDEYPGVARRDDVEDVAEPGDESERVPFCRECGAFSVPDAGGECGECGASVEYLGGSRA